jgi:hypothetical protein
MPVYLEFVFTSKCVFPAVDATNKYRAKIIDMWVFLGRAKSRMIFKKVQNERHQTF